jgi:hypothetical protein
MKKGAFASARFIRHRNAVLATPWRRVGAQRLAPLYASHAHMVDGAADLIVSKRAPRVQRVIEEASADR